MICGGKLGIGVMHFMHDMHMPGVCGLVPTPDFANFHF
jgi:hypothetical protein